MDAPRILVLVAGVIISLATLLSAVRVFVLPRATPSVLARIVFVLVRRLLLLFTRRKKTEDERDAVLANYAPLALFMLLLSWIVTILVSFTGIYWALGTDSLRRAFTTSGSSLLTLGFAQPDTLPEVMATFAEAALGLGILALVIAYLPSIYGAFTRREQEVASLETLAGSPPSPESFLVRHHGIQALSRLDPTWMRWQEWFAELEQTHSALPILCFFRSIHPHHSWVTAAGCVLDSAALTVAVLDIEREPEAELMIRGGYVGLRRIADFFSISYDPDPRPTDPISVTREEFDVLMDGLEEKGLPLKSDRDRAWRAYAGWRVNYDEALLGLCSLVMAPSAPWSSDRAGPYKAPPLTRRTGLGSGNLKGEN